MTETEQNHARCGDLRDILRQVQSRLVVAQEKERAKRTRLSQFRDQLSEKYDRLEELEEAEVALGIGSLISGPIGAEAGFSSANVGVEVTHLKSQIRDLSAQIDSIKHDLERIQIELDHLSRSQEENGRELTALGCVAP